MLYGPGLIQSRVVNFQFAHIITFLNRLPDDFIQKMTPEGSDKPAKKALHIQLHFFPDPDQHGMISRLRRWLNRLATEKRGAHIEVRYATDELMDDGDFKRVDKRVVSGAMIPYAKESVQCKEGDKIWGALFQRCFTERQALLVDNHLHLRGHFRNSKMKRTVRPNQYEGLRRRFNRLATSKRGIGIWTRYLAPR